VRLESDYDLEDKLNTHCFILGHISFYRRLDLSALLDFCCSVGNWFFCGELEKGREETPSSKPLESIHSQIVLYCSYASQTTHIKGLSIVATAAYLVALHFMLIFHSQA